MRLADRFSGASGLPVIVVQLVRFIGVGSLATFLHVAAAFLANLLGAPPLAANTVGFLCSVTTSYLGNFYWTFPGAAHAQSLGRFAVMSALAFVVTSGIAYVAQNILDWPFVAALALMVLVVPPMNFTLGRLWVFSARAGSSAWRGVDVAVLLASLAAATWFYAGTMPHHDVGWYLNATPLWLAGERLYEDILELNPPLTFYLMAPSALLSGLTGWPQMVSFVLVVFAATTASLLECRSLLGRSMLLTEGGRSAILAAAFFGLVVLPVANFGQREHLMMILALPYMMAAAFRPRLSVGERIGIGMAAALGFAIKPHFLVFPAVVTLVGLARDRKLSTLFSVENLVIGCFCVAYLAFALITYPAYFDTIVPIGLLVYGSYGVAFSGLLYWAALSFVLLVGVFLGSLGERRESAWPGTMLLALAAAAFLSFLLQSKGWNYHLVPINALLFIAWAWLAVSLAKTSPRRGRLSFMAAMGFSGGLVVLPALSGPYQNQVVQHLSPYLEELDGERSFLALVAQVSFSFPMANVTESRVTTRFPIWYIPGAVAQIGSGTELDVGRRRALEDVLDSARRIMAEDLVRGRPRVVFVDKRQDKPYFGGVAFDYLDFFLDDERFRDEWRNYRLIATAGEFEVWKRTDAIPGAPAPVTPASSPPG